MCASQAANASLEWSTLCCLPGCSVESGQHLGRLELVHRGTDLFKTALQQVRCATVLWGEIYKLNDSLAG